MMTAIELLARERAKMPGLAALEWKIRGSAGLANLLVLGDMRTEYEQAPDGPKSTLVIVPPADALAWVLALHELGWTRDGGNEYGMWLVDARLECDGAVLVVSGATKHKPEHDNGALPYFADPLPAMPLRGPMPKDWKARYAEWERKTREREW